MLKQIRKQWHVNTHEEIYEFAAREQNALYLVCAASKGWGMGVR
jgi:hypothetical protein